MNEPLDPNVTADIPASVTADSLDGGRAAGFGRPLAPRSSLGDLRPVPLQEPAGESEQDLKLKSDAMPTREETGDRYQLSGEIARGGMGAVLRGRDVDLGRDLAIKVLLEKYANRPDMARRFVEEAQIGGQLQHPGVVPVYDIGCFGDRPFFAMKLVKGQTLSAILSERADPSTDRPRLLGIASQVAQTLAYAHDKGVIHRDLKPANIMVGAFGEVQVMDWGLAKVLAEGGGADEERATSRELKRPEEGTLIRTARSLVPSGTHGSETEAGSMLGTPAYMPPEQANGDIANLDRRADVFGLGAILCEILTGKPPYVGRTGEEVRRKAANGDLADALARLADCAADAELIALTKRCLSPEAIDRPKDAKELAEGLTTYLNGVQERLQASERERAVAVVREAEQRKRKKVQLALAGAVAALVLGVGSLGWWQNDQANRRREQDLLRQLEDERRAAADKARQARTAEAVAGLLNPCEEALKASDAAKASLLLEAAKKRSREGGAEKDAERLDRLEADVVVLHDLDALDQFRWTIVDNKVPDSTVVALRTRELLRRFGADPDLVAADEAFKRVSTSFARERIVSALDRLLQKEKTAGVRSMLRMLDTDLFRDAVRDAVLLNDRVTIADLASQAAALEQAPCFTAILGENRAIDVERRRLLLRAAVSRRPGDLALLMTLGITYPMNSSEGADERLRWYQAAVAAAPENVAAQNNLGSALQEKGLLDESIACYKKAIELSPKLALAHNNLGNALRAKGLWDEAVARYRKALEYDPTFASALNNLGVALMDKGEWNEAVTCYKKAIELDPKLALAYYSLGNAVRDNGRLNEAISNYRKAIELDPTLAKAHNNLGGAVYALGQLNEAIACYKKAIELDPKEGSAFNNLGNALGRKGQVDEAIACYKKAIQLNPKNASAYNNLGNTLRDKGQLDDAIACYRQSIEIQPRFALAHNNLGTALQSKGRLDDAVAEYKEALRIEPKHALALVNLPRVERMVASRDKFSAYQSGAYRPSSSGERLDLVEWCAFKKLYATAVGLYSDAFAADPKLAEQLQFGHRYNAACSASLAASGQSEDAVKLDTRELTQLRKQALDWLRADLALQEKQLANGKLTERNDVIKRLGHWRKDTDLAGIRDAQALAKLPSEEQHAFAQLWADVAALLKKAEETDRTGSPAQAKTIDKTLELAPLPRKKK